MKVTRTAACLLTAALALPMWPTTPAPAAQTVKLEASLTPERLGAGTTLYFGFQIAGPHGEVPPPLSTVNLLYPANLGLITSGLGLSTCSRTELEAQSACPPNSLMGYGTALAEVPFGPDTIRETAQITTWMAPIEQGHLGLLFLAQGQTPVRAELIFTSHILAANRPFGGAVATTLPLIPSLPEAPNVSVTRLNTTLGPMHITYYQRFHGKTTAYHPTGIRLPHTCPHGGFPFAAELTFQNGTQTTAHTTVPCPPPRH